MLNWPNLLTVIRILLTPVFLWLLFSEQWYSQMVAFAIFILAAVTDFYDGKLARSKNRVTSLGRFLDPLADKILVLSALVGLTLRHLVHYWLVVPVIVRDILITGMRIYGLYRGRQMLTSRLAKWKTALQLFAIACILFCSGMQDVLQRYGQRGLDEQWVVVLANGLMVGVLTLTLLSGLQYMVRGSFFKTSTK